jgi:hypothetical protein
MAIHNQATLELDSDNSVASSHMSSNEEDKEVNVDEVNIDELEKFIGSTNEEHGDGGSMAAARMNTPPFLVLSLLEHQPLKLLVLTSPNELQSFQESIKAYIKWNSISNVLPLRPKWQR